MRESVRKNRENPAKPAVKIIDMKHAIMYNNEIVKVSLDKHHFFREYDVYSSIEMLFSDKRRWKVWKQRRHYSLIQD